MHCVLEYPTPIDHSHLSRIQSIGEIFPDVYLGYSDHTKPENKLIIPLAYALGARTVEKHFTLNKFLPGNDHYHAMDEDDIKSIIQSIISTEMILGCKKLQYLDTESNARLFARRSCVLKKNVIKGQILTPDLVEFKRPGYGIKPEDLEFFLGKKFIECYDSDSILTIEMLTTD
jgi:N-acetylneuraminate synthase